MKTLAARLSENDQRLFDKGSTFELYEDFGNSVFTAFARLNGATVCIIATKGETIKSDDSTAIARTIQIADTLSIPVITFLNSQGLDSADASATRNFAKLAYMYSKADMVKFVVCSGKVYGSAYLILAGKGSNSDAILAWDSAIITPLSPEASIAFMKSDIISQDRPRGSLEEEYMQTEASAHKAASHGVVDFVIKPENTRIALIDAMNSIKPKISKNKKYGNIPF